MHVRGRPLALAGIIVLMGGIAALVARPRVPAPATVPYAGIRGASLAKSAGLVAYWRRGDETRPLEPGQALRAGDQLLFKVRTDQPRFLEVRTRSAGGGEKTVFPAGGSDAGEVRSGQALPVTVTIDDGPGALVVVGYFADHPFPVGRPAAPDLARVVIEVPKEK
jgi:hypothetical protein